MCKDCDAETNYSVKNSGTGDLPTQFYNDVSNRETFTFPEGTTLQYFNINIHPSDEENYGKLIIYQLFEEDEEPPIATFYLRLDEVRIKPDLGSYRLLGTNFDFIDGVDLKSQYYHLQVFQPKAFSKKFGFVGGLQRNRQVSFSDTISSQLKLQSSGVLYRLSPYLKNDTLYQITQVDSPAFKRTRTSNVFCIYFEPTFRIFPKKNSTTTSTNLYVFGHADIVFRKSIN